MKTDKTVPRPMAPGPRRRRSFLLRALGASAGCVCGGAAAAGCGGAPDEGAAAASMVPFPPMENGRFALELERFPQLKRPGGSLVGRPAGMPAIIVVRDGEDHFWAASATCTHMACPLRFNTLNVTYDCHCHGSSFELDGTVINGPATVPLETFRATLDGGILIVSMEG